MMDLDTTSAPVLLSVRDVTLQFGGITALNRVSFDVAAGRITALIGPNGAGKTTLFNCITGFYRVDHGSIRLRQHDGMASPDGSGQPDLDLVDLLRRSAWLGGSHRVAQAGIARTFQNIRLFREMTVMENLLVARFARRQFATPLRLLLSGLWRSARYRRVEEEAIAWAVAGLRLFGLLDDANRRAGDLPYGRQRRLEIIRALALEPRLLCLDEPAAGLNPRETEELRDILQQLQQRDRLTLLLIEHDMPLVMSLSHTVVVLNHGEVIMQGTPQQVRQDPQVIRAYLGCGMDSDSALGGEGCHASIALP
jgi:branched-chain amino acid transport system ATP-binding protein